MSSIEIKIEVNVEVDPNIELLRNMSFGQFMKKNLCAVAFMSTITFGMWLFVEKYLYNHRIQDYLIVRNRQRKFHLALLKKSGYEAHFTESGRVVIDFPKCEVTL